MGCEPRRFDRVARIDQNRKWQKQEFFRLCHHMLNSKIQELIFQSINHSKSFIIFVFFLNFTLNTNVSLKTGFSVFR